MDDEHYTFKRECLALHVPAMCVIACIDREIEKIRVLSTGYESGAPISQASDVLDRITNIRNALKTGQELGLVESGWNVFLANARKCDKYVACQHTVEFFAFGTGRVVRYIQFLRGLTQPEKTALWNEYDQERGVTRV